MKRGDVYWVNFDPSIGGEIRKKRPAIIICNDAACKFSNRLQVVPLTSNVSKLYPSEAYVNVGDRKAKAMADQLATVSKERLISLFGSVSQKEMKEVERAIRVQLGLK